MDQVFIAQLEEIVSEYRNALGRSQHDDASDVLSAADVSELITRGLSAIERASGTSSTYMERARTILQTKGNDWGYLPQVIGVTNSLKHDISSGYLKSFEELIHGDIFSDYLEMAEHLCATGYKDAAAVIAGSTLEAHIKKLCTKFSVALENDGRPKKADTLNADLVKAGAYSKLDQKGVTFWLGLRNDAAHGDYNNYTKEQIELLIQNVRNFIVRHAA
ncbi:MAG: hypothetical protein ACJAW7_002404 [Candidatus Azotimanducaceae bacterium]|jgi:hypothetical protein